MKLKQVNITFLVETDDILDTINAIDEEVQETWSRMPEAEVNLAFINGLGDKYNISYHIKLEDKHEPADNTEPTDNTESEAEASDSYPDVLEPLEF